MKREDALKTVDAVDYFGMNTDHKVELSKDFINIIYDDFKNQTCSNCIYKNGCGIFNALFMAKSFGAITTSLDRFGCNEWELKS